MIVQLDQEDRKLSKVRTNYSKLLFQILFQSFKEMRDKSEYVVIEGKVRKLKDIIRHSFDNHCYLGWFPRRFAI